LEFFSQRKKERRMKKSGTDVAPSKEQTHALWSLGRIRKNKEGQKNFKITENLPSLKRKMII
jgi:hypothetical protein